MATVDKHSSVTSSVLGNNHGNLPVGAISGSMIMAHWFVPSFPLRDGSIHNPSVFWRGAEADTAARSVPCNGKWGVRSHVRTDWSRACVLQLEGGNQCRGFLLFDYKLRWLFLFLITPAFSVFFLSLSLLRKKKKMYLLEDKKVKLTWILCQLVLPAPFWFLDS